MWSHFQIVMNVFQSRINFEVMNAFKIFCLSIGILCWQQGLGQNAHQLLRKGDKAYNQERFELAEENYRKAIEKKPNTKGSFNLGNTVYNQERFEEAAQHYQQTLNGLSEEEKKAETLYNLGNAQLQSGQLEEAIESYKGAVLLDPEDDNSVIPQLNYTTYQNHKSNGIISAGMVPKLDNAFSVLRKDVPQIVIGNIQALSGKGGTLLSL